MFHRLFCFGILQLLIVSNVQAQDSKPQITISKETTYITSPLRPDGRVDYVEALSQMQREGVTPENNSVVMFRRALGHRDLKPEIAEEYFRQLGMEVLPKEGDYLIDLDDFVKTIDPSELPESGGNAYEVRQAIYRQDTEARSRPWTRDEFPIIARWIDTNEIPLRFAVEGSARSRFFEPLLPKDRTFAMAVFPNAQCFREIATLLNTRATLRIGEGNTDAAWQDVMASHRFARLVAQGPTNISKLVAIAIESMTCLRDDQIASHGEVNAETFQLYLEELRSIGPIHGFGETAIAGDRIWCLAMICEFSQMDSDKLLKGLPWIFLDVDETDHEKLDGFFTEALDNGLIDWNELLKQANLWFDRYAVAMQLVTRIERNTEIERLDEEVRRIAKKAQKIIRGKEPNKSKMVSKTVENMLLTRLLSSHHNIEANDRCEMRTQLSHCVLALAAWKADHGSYPDQIDQLAPDLLKTVPIDIFTGQPLIYRRTDTGYLLYSVGINLKDDEGFTLLDTHETDDIAIRTPDEDQRIQAIVRKRRGQE